MNAIGLALAALLVLGDPPSNPPATEAPRNENAKPELSTPASPSASSPPVPFPHPLITEVLYAVPTGPAGDANGDGKREVAGDEFIELINPHDRPIQLFGYALTDSQEPGKGQLKFTFPALELPPGGVAVVFNGAASTFTGPVGDAKAPAEKPSDAFGGAWVFTMRNANNKTALGNSGDHVLLTAPDGTPVHRVWWSEDPAAGAAAAAPANAEPALPGIAPAQSAPKTPLLDDAAPLISRTSVQRDGVLATGRFVSHLDAERTPFSPGVYTMPARPHKP